MKRKDSHHRTTIDYSSKDSSKNGKPKLNGKDQNKSENDFNRVTQNEPIELDDLSFEDSEFSESKESGESEDCSMPSIKSNEERKVFLSQKAKTQKLLDILKEKMFQQRSVGELK